MFPFRSRTTFYTHRYLNQTTKTQELTAGRLGHAHKAGGPEPGGGKALEADKARADGGAGGARARGRDLPRRARLPREPSRPRLRPRRGHGRGPVDGTRYTRTRGPLRRVEVRGCPNEHVGLANLSQR